jgi:two-component system, chemotaxis family, sensor kinase CheA
MDDLLKDFVVETSEHLDIVDAELVRFERDPNNSATLALIFRLVHTIKGTCGFLGLPRLEHLAHAAEDVISRFRDGEPVTAPAVTMILKTIDRIKGIVGELDRSGTEPEGHDEDLVDALRALASGKLPDIAAPAMPEVKPEAEGTISFQILERSLREDEVTLDDLERAFRDAPGPDAVAFVEPEPPVSAAPPKPVKIERKDQGEPGEADHANQNSTTKQTVRVAVGTLDRLMTMVSELVLTRNQLLEIARQRDDGDFKSPLQRLSHITAELQDGVMQTRMQPIGSAWTKLSRVVRDLTEELGKKIELIQNGAETEIDRQLLEMIKDPLLHMVRNAADHGLEMPDERLAAGKPAHGTINLRAAQESGYIIVEVSDDGRGIDLERVKAKAIRNGMTTEQDIARMSDEQVLRFVMEPGFSTAAAVTNISGRGVGLDVVRSHVEQVGGIVDLRSRQGKGLTVTIKLPLTLAIASALIVEAAGQRFAIPQISVAELVRTQAAGDVRIEKLNGQATLRLRQKLLPVVEVADVLSIERMDTGNENSGTAHSDDQLVVVCHVGGHRFGIVVDSILHTEEIVVKPISSKLRHMSVYSGATILGDGSVILILEPAGIARSVMESAGREFAAQAEADLASEIHASAERSLLLLFRAGGTNLKAIPLSFIGRLEEFDRAAIEDTGGKAVVQYQGRLMPILGYMPSGSFDLDARQPVLVFHQQDREIGMAVDEIVDVVEVAIQIDTSHATHGTVGATIIDGKAVEIVDVSELVAPEAAGKPIASDDAIDVMVIEGSEFFRALFAPLLQNAGYRIAVVPSMQAARAAMGRQQPSVLVLDLDPSGEEGFNFVRELAETGNAAPVIGLVSRGGPRLIEQGKAAGLHDLVGKFDRQGLLSSIGDILGGYSMNEWGAAA